MVQTIFASPNVAEMEAMVSNLQFLSISPSLCLSLFLQALPVCFVCVCCCVCVFGIFHMCVHAHVWMCLYVYVSLCKHVCVFVMMFLPMLNAIVTALIVGTVWPES